MQFWHFLFSISHIIWTAWYIEEFVASRKKIRKKSRNINPMVPKYADDGDDEGKQPYPPTGFGMATLINMIAILGYAWFDSIGI